MIFEKLETIQSKIFHTIIIGSGPAGITTALKLEAQGLDTLIVEAGSEKSNPNDLKYLDGTTTGDNYTDLKFTRLRQFGGTSGLWGGVCDALNKNDFKDWPINKKDLDLYLNETKKILNIRNDFYYKKFSDNLNYFNLSWSDVRFKEKYFDYIKKSKKISLSLNTIFCNFEGSDGNVENILCYKNKFIKLKSKYYILSCGGIENSRLLLISKNKFPQLFAYDLPIGKYYIDHPKHKIGSGIIEFKKLKNYAQQRNINLPNLECENLQLSLNELFQRKNNVLNSAVSFRFKRVNTSSNLIKQAACVAPKFIQKIYSSIKEKDVYEFSLSIIQEQQPSYNIQIQLSNKVDPLGLPLPKVHWERKPLMRNSAIKIIDEISKLFIKNDIGRLAINEKILIDNNYKITLGNHQMGGTRIGENIDDSVVNEHLLVHGFKNLYINGSSVFRTGGHAHPTFSIVQLATRLGEHLSKA